MPLRSTPVEGMKRKQEWAEEETNLQYGPRIFYLRPLGSYRVKMALQHGLELVQDGQTFTLPHQSVNG